MRTKDESICSLHQTGPAFDRLILQIRRAEALNTSGKAKAAPPKKEVVKEVPVAKKQLCWTHGVSAVR